MTLRQFVRGYILIFFIILVTNLTYGSIFQKDYGFISRNVSATLDNLLDKKRYDKRIRPDFGTQPIQITVNIQVKSMGSVSETDETFSMDIYFRQTWRDPRLTFSIPGQKELSLSWIFMDLVWKPDTYFMNGKKSYLHRITVPNKFLRLNYDGSVVYSMRLTVQARCPMHLRKFPLDAQKCPLLISSYGYRRNDLIYRWETTNSKENVKIEPNMEIAQYDLTNVTTLDNQIASRGNSGKDEHSMIKAVFHLKRHTGFFMLQVYVPCGLIVCCSWVSFWIDPDAVPARVHLGVTTALSLTTLGFGGKAQMPKVPYATALDWFIILCFFFVFGVMIEFATINFIDKITAEWKRILKEKGIVKRKKPIFMFQIRRKSRMSILGDDTLNIPKDRQRSASMVNIPSSGPALSAPLPYAIVNIHADAPDPAPSVRVDRSGGTYGRIHRRGDTPEVRVVSPIIRIMRRLSSAVSVRRGVDEDDNPVMMDGGSRVNLLDVPRITVSRRHSESNVSEISAETVYEDDVHEHIYDEIHDVIDMEDDVCEDDRASRISVAVGNIVSNTRSSFKRFLMKPIDLWKDFEFLPGEEEVTRQVNSGEIPDKFGHIDIKARKIFPISFCVLLLIYSFAYMYYITDDFPVKEFKTLRRKRL